MKIQRQNTLSGKFIKGDELQGITKAVIVSEAKEQPSSFTDKNGNPKLQTVCKVKFEGKDDIYNISLNKATLNGLIEAFGDETKDWVKQVLAVETEKVRVGGVARIAIYLIPDGYERVDNEDGFAEIVKVGAEKNIADPNDIPVINEEEEIDTKDIPF